MSCVTNPALRRHDIALAEQYREIFAGIDAKKGVLGEAYHASHHLCEETCVIFTQVSSLLILISF
jgi:hypothetical protein